MEDMIDIQGLDEISIWPLAYGWWIMLGFISIIVLIALYFIWQKLRYRKSWQYESMQRLNKIEAQIPECAHKIILQNLSIELRKIAMLSTKRETCAGLSGKEWLQWLQQNDPEGFAWQERGDLLISAQYMPNTNLTDSTLLNTLINAAKGWVKKC